MSVSNDNELLAGGALLLLLVAMGAGGEKPDPGPKPTGPKGFGGGDQKPTPADPPKPDPKPDPKPEPKDDPEPMVPTIPEIVNPDYPTAGMFYPVAQGDFGYRIASRALKQAAFMAAREFGGLSVQQANTFASNWGGDAQRQVAYLDAITCEAWNDATVTTHGYGDKAKKAPSGRAIRMLPLHADNLARLEQGKKAIRNIRFGQPSDKTNGVKRGAATNRWSEGFEVLFLPSVDLKAIWETGALKIGGGPKWPDGTSRGNPPRWAMKLGVLDKSESTAKGNKQRGCGSGKAKIKVTH